MNSGVELIIERIKACPDEFLNFKNLVGDGSILKEGKWESFVSGVFSRKKQIDKTDSDTWGKNLFYLDDDEIVAIYDAIKETCRESLCGGVLEVIATPEQPQRHSFLSNTLFAGGGGNLVWNNATNTLETLEEKIDKLQEAYAKQFETKESQAE